LSTLEFTAMNYKRTNSLGKVLECLNDLEFMVAELKRQNQGDLPPSVKKIEDMVGELQPKVRKQTRWLRTAWRQTGGRIAWGPTIAINAILSIFFG